MSSASQKTAPPSAMGFGIVAVAVGAGLLGALLVGMYFMHENRRQNQALVDLLASNTEPPGATTLGGLDNVNATADAPGTPPALLVWNNAASEWQNSAVEVAEGQILVWNGTSFEPQIRPIHINTVIEPPFPAGVFTLTHLNADVGEFQNMDLTAGDDDAVAADNSGTVTTLVESTGLMVRFVFPTDGAAIPGRLGAVVEFTAQISFRNPNTTVGEVDYYFALAQSETDESTEPVPIPLLSDADPGLRRSGVTAAADASGGLSYPRVHHVTVTRTENFDPTFDTDTKYIRLYWHGQPSDTALTDDIDIVIERLQISAKVYSPNPSGGLGPPPFP